jgi:GntR family transcriptional repressor for pyruvate dehydrogenase complex
MSGMKAPKMTGGGRAAGAERPARASRAARKPSAVRAAADALRRDAIDREDGELLGAEEDLIRRYGVSRPTLRQAAALVAQENLLRVKRGVGGGYFVSRPDSRGVAHMAAIYLRTRHTRVSEIIGALAPIRIEVARLAAAGDNAPAREEMRQFLAKDREVPDDQIRYRDFLRSERDFGRILGELGGNKVIALYLDILYDFSGMLGRGEDIYVNRPDRVNEYRDKRNRLAEAIIDGDVELAVVAARRCAMAAQEWMVGDLGRQSTSSAFLHLAGEPSPPEAPATPKPRKAAASRARV